MKKTSETHQLIKAIGPGEAIHLMQDIALIARCHTGSWHLRFRLVVPCEGHETNQWMNGASIEDSCISARDAKAARRDPRMNRVDWRNDCVAIIACFNEAISVKDVVAQTLQHLPTVLVVDDGSSDETGNQAAAAGAKVICHQTNLGKGMALRTGFDHARSLGFTWGLTLDGDGQHAPEDIPNFLACAEATAAPLIIGDRLGEPEKIPRIRRLVNLWMTARLSRLSGVPLADSQCGFRLIKLDAVAHQQLVTSHFETESELLVKYLRAGLKVEFVPVQVIYRTGESKIHPIVDAWRWLRWWFAQG